MTLKIGFQIDRNSATVTNCTFSDNMSHVNGQSFGVDHYRIADVSSVEIHDCIFRDYHHDNLISFYTQNTVYRAWCELVNCSFVSNVVEGGSFGLVDVNSYSGLICHHGNFDNNCVADNSNKGLVSVSNVESNRPSCRFIVWDFVSCEGSTAGLIFGKSSVCFGRLSLEFCEFTSCSGTGINIGCLNNDVSITNSSFDSCSVGASGVIAVLSYDSGTTCERILFSECNFSECRATGSILHEETGACHTTEVLLSTFWNCKSARENAIADLTCD